MARAIATMKDTPPRTLDAADEAAIEAESEFLPDRVREFAGRHVFVLTLANARFDAVGTR